MKVLSIFFGTFLPYRMNLGGAVHGSQCLDRDSERWQDLGDLGARLAVLHSRCLNVADMLKPKPTWGVL
jgi:hypothetical protein